MAISATHYALLKLLKERGVLPQGGAILEIGQANWYGDADASEFADGAVCPFEVVRRLYIKLFAPALLESIDLDPYAPEAYKLDLNQDLLLKQRYDVTYNHGTAEHIFNIGQVFRTMHDWTKPGGLMLHEAPLRGWHDHGFYNLQPTLFYDMAATNDYQIELVAVEHLASRVYILIDSHAELLELARRDQLPDNSMLFVAMRKLGDEPFKIPMQGIYSERATEQMGKAWMALR